MATQLALEESHAKYCYMVNPTYDDLNVPAVRVPANADFGSLAEFEVITPRLKSDKYFEPYVVDYDVDIEQTDMEQNLLSEESIATRVKRQREVTER